MSIWDEITDEYREFINKDFERIDNTTSVLDIVIQGDEPEPFMNKWNRQQYRIEVAAVKVNARDYGVGKNKKTVFEVESIYGGNKWLAGGIKLFGCLKVAKNKGHRFIRLYRHGSGFNTSYTYEKIEESKQKNIT